MSSKCGIVVSSGKRDGVAMLSSHVEAVVVGPCAQVSLVQKFRNALSDVSLECRFFVALRQPDSHSRATVSSFTATLPDGRVVRAIVKGKEKAAAKYDDSIASGHGAFLVERDEDSEGEFSCSIGSLVAGGDVTIELSFVAEVGADVPGVLSLSLPASSLRPESPETVSVTISAPYTAASISSPSHPGVAFAASSRASFAASVPSKLCTDELVVRAELIPDSPIACGFLERHTDGSGASAVVSFFPRGLCPSVCPGEVVFLLDRSGSMAGQSIEQAKATLGLFLRSLPPGSHFNVISFGSRCEQMFTGSAAYDDKSLNEACRIIEGMQANLGGTNILPALNGLFSVPRKSADVPRHVFVLTDGDIESQSEVIACVRKHSADTRVFAIGIAGSNPAFLTRMCLAGRGAAETVGDNDSMRSVVIRQLKRALSSALVMPRVDFGSLQRSVEFTVPEASDFLFAGENLLVYAQCNDVPGVVSSLKVSLTAKNIEPVEVPITEAPAGSVVVQKLAAFARVRALVEEKVAEQKPTPGAVTEAVALCERFQIASRVASFVGVEERNGVAQQQSSVLVDRPVSPPAPPAVASQPSGSPAGGLFSRLFGRKQPQATPTVSDTVRKLNEVTRDLERREVHLQKSKEECARNAKKALAANNKERAMLELKKRRIFDRQAAAVQEKIMEIRSQSMCLAAATGSADSLQAMRSGATSLRGPRIDPSRIEDVQDTMDAINEISEAISAPATSLEPDDDLESELSQLVDECGLSVECTDQPASMSQPPAKQTEGAAQSNNGDNDELQLLERLMALKGDPAPPSVSVSASVAVAPSPVVQLPPPPPAKPKEVASEDNAPLALAGLQSADGHWADSLALRSILLKHLGFDPFAKLASQLPSDIVATAVVVAFLRARFPAEVAGDLELVVAKAVAWLFQQAQLHPDYLGISEAAAKLF